MVGDRVTTTLRKNEYDEWVVRVRIDGSLFGEYFASDKDDAEKTMRAMVASVYSLYPQLKEK